MAEETQGEPVVDAEPTSVEEEKEKAMETARAQAEARRKRILEKANNRMQYVDGSGPQNEDEKKESLSKAARIRAARQRRYGKKSSAPATTTPATEPESDGAEKAKEETPEVTEENNNEKPEIAPSVSEDSTPPQTETTAPSTASAEPKKKYVGVARMRRKMMKKKKMEEESSNENAAGSDSGTASASDGKSTMPASTTPPVQTIPIYMHILVILLLFVAGFDVGVQQFHVDVNVSHKLAIHEYGVPFLHRNPWNSLESTSTEKNAKETLEDKLGGTSGESIDAEKSEFDFEDVEYKPPNIDPIFRVDLDELTKGPGLMNQMARGAISIHRLLLWIFWFAPMGFFGSILSIPTTLMKSPPGLFAIALILRQFVGKAVLGASITDDSGNEGSDSKQSNIEVLSVAKNFVKNFFAQTFPKVVTLYDVYLYLKTDMYVVFCGVFLGLAWSHQHVEDGSCEAEPLSSSGGYGDEL